MKKYRDNLYSSYSGNFMGLSSNLSALSNPHFSPKFPMINVATLSLLFFYVYFIQNRDILILYVPQFSVFHHITRLFGYFLTKYFISLIIGIQNLVLGCNYHSSSFFFSNTLSLTSPMLHLSDFIPLLNCPWRVLLS